MKTINIPKLINRAFAIFLGFLGIVALVSSLLFERWEELKNESLAIFLLVVFYYLLLLVYVFWKSDDVSLKWRFKEVSLSSFVINCLFYPACFMILLFVLSVSVEWLEWNYIRGFVLLLHVFIIALWTVLKLKKLSKLNESDLMKIDIISTLAILPLTIVWILYDTKIIIWEFSVMMGEFLVIQLVIKIILMKRKEKEEQMQLKYKRSGYKVTNN